MLAAVPLNLTVLSAVVAPKSVPVIVTAVPALPDTGVMDAIAGVGVTGEGPLFLQAADSNNKISTMGQCGTCRIVFISSLIFMMLEQTYSKALPENGRISKRQY
jgi:hypothetical protein